ncbi:hypothetical protein DY000_02019473 [Brassica cretica]|uniref:Uncharacterized protein n=1 Tax=Brassica cretica TaxID=69181 RepID=A0ABQ7D0D5_BRACR|nr:hypothetical protein DY000_02019473 [Brassica cretica]
MRLAFDQQQQDLVDAASKALSYRQEIIEENIRLTYALQAAEQERSTFVSYLLPLLSEYSLHPQMSDSQSIVSNVKVLFRHLQEKLLFTETKLKETEYQLAPWQSDVNHSNASPLSPYHPVGASLRYSTDQEQYHQDGRGVPAASNYHLDGPESRSPAFQMPLQPAFNQDESNGPNNRVQFREPLSNTFMDDPYAEVQADTNQTSENANYAAGGILPNSIAVFHFVLKCCESLLAAADDDPLPGIADLQISGEPFPGRELLASGHSIHGTTKCNFEVQAK